jgi:hypothetical protein
MELDVWHYVFLGIAVLLAIYSALTTRVLVNAWNELDERAGERSDEYVTMTRREVKDGTIQTGAEARPWDAGDFGRLALSRQRSPAEEGLE